MVTVMQSSFGTTKPDGGTQFAGQYFVMDPSTEQAIFVYKSKAAPPLAYDPVRGEAISADGTISRFPSDAGSLGQVQLGAPGLSLADQGSGTIASPLSATATQLADTSSDNSLVGFYVSLPTGSYTEDYTAPEFTHVSGSKTYHNGIALTDGSGDRILVDTYTFLYSSANCVPTDGGLPDLHLGGFNGVLDRAVTDDHNSHKVLFYGHCGQ